MCKQENGAAFSLNGSDWKLKDFVGEDWVWRNAQKRGTKDARFWHKGSVPSGVIADLWRAGVIPDPYYEKNSLLIEWVPERTWIYRKTFEVPERMKGRRIRLHFEGIDYDAKIYLNDILLGTHHSMYTPAEFDVTKILAMEEENLLSVVIEKAPEEQPQVGETPLVRTHKCRMTYWWDFCPRMIHQGIWDDVWLEADGGVSVSDLWVRTGEVNFGKGTAASVQVTVQFTLDASEDSLKPVSFIPGKLTSSPVSAETLAKRLPVKVRLEIAGSGGTVYETTYSLTVLEGGTTAEHTFEMKNAELWYPNGSGAQPLYTAALTVLDSASGEVLHEKRVRFGIRDLKFVPNETADPTARNYTVCVNRKKLYMKGWNWAPIDVLYGEKRPEKLRRLLTLAKRAGVNCLRVWGGGLIEREEFYDLCDEFGILVWQEFVQSSSGIDNQPPADPAFLDFLRNEAEQIIPRKRNHPSLALWCGGNELQSAGGRIIRDDEPAIRVLRRAAAELDPGRYFLPSSPSGRIFNNDLRLIEADPEGLHDVHGPWEHQGLTAQYTLYNHGTALLSSEFGAEGMTNFGTLAKSMDERNFWPPSRDNYLYFHRGSWWVNYPFVQECFGGEITEIKTMIKASQFLQYEGLKYAVEAMRRRAFQSSGSLPWQFNEPYPNNYCTCAVDYYAQPKPAYYGVAKAYENRHVSAEFAMQAWGGEETVSARIYYQESGSCSGKIRVISRIIGASGRICAETAVEAEAENCMEKAVCVGEVSVRREEIEEDIFFLDILAVGWSGTELSAARYPFTTQTDLTAFLHQPEAEIRTELIKECCGGRIWIVNEGNTAALCVWLQDAEEPGGDGGLYFDNNYFSLLPGEEKTVQVQVCGREQPRVLLNGFNIADRILTYEKEDVSVREAGRE